MSIPKQSRKNSKEVDDFDISILKTLPRQLIGEAVSYLKNKKHLEELEARRKKKEEDEKLSKVKCIPPWAKTLAGERKPDERKDVATQYEMYCEGREGEREGSQEKDLKDGSDMGGDSSGGEGFDRDGAMREFSDDEEEEGDEEWRKKMEEEGRDEGMEGGDRDASDLEGLEREDGIKEDDKLKHGSKDRGIDEEGDELEDRDKTDKHSDEEGERRKSMSDGEEKHDKGSVSSSKDGEAIDDEVDDEGRKKKLDGDEDEDEGDEETGRINRHYIILFDGDSLLLEGQEEEGKWMSDSDYEKDHEGSSGDQLKVDVISSEFAEGGETRGSTELLGEGEMKTEAGDKQVEEEEAEINIEERMGNDSKYLKKHFGNYLVKALAEIAWKRPADPIHYLAHRLYHFRHIEEITVKNYCEEKEIQEARNLYAMEMQEQTGIAEETENIGEDEELEEAEIVAETVVQEYEDMEDSTSADDISQLLTHVEPEERLSPAELGF
ncbi:hypothetical protein LSTR_LSTR007358 [Laodelphax striatellus]|uniref:Uncharacterized protein n=1 Tax=Laodelphax striatellus TaxID=195883 RepID=A0A482XR93_LAOST|nr:hypothetical protein LSTR_LSTR007358 [Laodelphax striatellus]